MMHDPNRHPDAERLSALAEGDAEATGDRTLSAHVASCEPCRTTVDELAALRAALAALPDMAPPRPLRLLAPAAEPRSSGGLVGLRRLFAPALAAGLLLTLVGGAGSLGTLLSGVGASGAAPQPAEIAEPAAGQGATGGEAPTLQSFRPGDDASRRNLADDQAEGAANQSPGLQDEFVWVVVLAAGVVLVAVALVVRFAVQPGAG